ncbi:MAG: STAS domain-containing protein [Gomphosphaeria aponina SAG 52.96 = DSM 107014]|uniref:Anti-sigma factor antagonist n=1 Tax=Gomphosphaeria aponina SAG 52.96 = DSM 107014 TaxID=1521640 RepID=A0A941GQ21_9CHRO|nr:STAS domain-containing protein [Gomphosphaeria aponina SAG 52.96 = DSM 107014]
MRSVKIAKIGTVEPSGAVSAANAGEFQQQLTQVVKNESHNIIIVDMKKVEFLDSAGLMVLVEALHLAKSLGRRLIICSIAPSVRMVFELTQLDKVFEMVENRLAVESALREPLAA